MIENLWSRVLLMLYFMPVFIVGIAGNLWVILSVCRILHKTRSPLNYTFRHMAMYILSLSIADIAVLCMVPMLLSYFLDGHWRFGLIGCKIFFTVENINKLLSVAILTVMSFERFLAISGPFYWLCCRLRRKRLSNVLVVVLLLLAGVVLLCSPMIYYADLKPLELRYDDGSIESSTQALCGSNLPDQVMSFFIVYMFVLGFLLPLLCISLCYFFLVQHLRKTRDSLQECWPRGSGMFVTACTTKVVRSILRVVGFHMICWGPFWLFVLIPIIEYFQLMSKLPRALDNEFSRSMRMISSFLPYLNSAGNWVFYAAMNRELRDAVTVMGNTGMTTVGVGSFRRHQNQNGGGGFSANTSTSSISMASLLLRNFIRPFSWRRHCISSEKGAQNGGQNIPLNLNKRRELVQEEAEQQQLAKIVPNAVMDEATRSAGSVELFLTL